MKKIYNILVNPLQTMLPFLLSTALLSAIVVILCPDNTENLVSGYGVGNVSVLYCCAIIIALIPHVRTRKTIEISILSFTCFLDIIETFCCKNFGIFISPTLIQLISETNALETKGFFYEYVFRLSSLPLFITYVVAIALIVYLYKGKYITRISEKIFENRLSHHAVIIIPFLAICIASLRSPFNQKYMSLVTSNNVSEFELKYSQANAYSNLQRLVLSLRLVYLTTKETNDIIHSLEQTKVQGCSHKSPLIVLIVGESCIKNHSQLYGYQKETTPFQLSEKKNGRLFAFTNCITSINLTSIVFKNLFSSGRVDDGKIWYSQAFFPRVLKLGGYHTTLISNQFLPTKRSMFDFLGGFYLNNPKVSQLMFDERNKETSELDEKLLPVFNKSLEGNSPYKFILFHELGMHIPYSEKYPVEKTVFKVADYSDRNELSEEERQTVAHYDNATRYNDSVKAQIIKSLENREAIVIFVSDHGEEVFDYTHRVGRTHKSFTPDILLSEYRVPLWIWCSDSYIDKHQDIMSRIKKSQDLPFMTDDLPHLIYDLAGIESEDYHQERSIIHPAYDTHRKRMVGPQHDHCFDSIVNR